MYGMERGLLNLGFSLGPLVGGSIYETSLGHLYALARELASDSRTMKFFVVETSPARGLPYTVSACCLCASALVYLSLPISSSASSRTSAGPELGWIREVQALDTT